MDEFLKMIMEAAEKQAKQQGSRPGNSSMNYDEVSAIKKDVTQTAKFVKMQYDQFVAVGFSEDQAMELTIAFLN